jgi:hypothetical protein
MPPEEQQVEDKTVGTDDTLSVNDTVNSLADSLKINDVPLEGTEASAAAPPEAPAEPPRGEEKAPEGEAKAEVPPEVQPELKVPDTWKPDAQTLWSGVDPVVKAEINRREQEIAKYVGEVQPYVTHAQTWDKIMAPFMPAFQQYKVNPFDHVNGLLHAHYNLLFGRPEQKIQLIQGLIRDIGLDPRQLFDPNAKPEERPWAKEVGELRSALQQVDGGFKQVSSAMMERQVSDLAEGVMKFAQDEENHPWFWDVVDDVKNLIDAGAARSLEEAYNMAVLRNPETQAKRLAADRAKDDAKLKTEAAMKVAAAKKATAANVVSRGQGRRPEPEETVDQTIRNTMKQIRERETK